MCSVCSVLYISATYNTLVVESLQINLLCLFNKSLLCSICREEVTHDTQSVNSMCRLPQFGARLFSLCQRVCYYSDPGLHV